MFCFLTKFYGPKGMGFTVCLFYPYRFLNLDIQAMFACMSKFVSKLSLIQFFSNLSMHQNYKEGDYHRLNMYGWALPLEFLILQVWGRVPQLAYLTNSQMIVILLGPGLYFENHCSKYQCLENAWYNMVLTLCSYISTWYRKQWGDVQRILLMQN